MSGARALNDQIFADLSTGMLKAITKAVSTDRDLIMEFRGNYFNVYYKGQNLVAVKKSGQNYICSSSEKFTGDEGELSPITNETECASLVGRFSSLKDRIGRHRKHANELEKEQMLIRTNNYESALNTEYFMIDRQFMEPGNQESGRPDMLGLYWSLAKRNTNREAHMVLFEVKYSLNPDISDIAEQVCRYRKWLTTNLDSRKDDLEKILRQKVELGLFASQGKDRSAALRELRISNDPEKAQIMLVFVDYNPNSKMLNIESLKKLPFANQVRVAHVGFGLWFSRTQSIMGSVL